VTGLAFTDELRVTEAKVGIFAASLGAALTGWAMLRRGEPSDVPEVPDEDGPPMTTGAPGVA